MKIPDKIKIGGLEYDCLEVEGLHRDYGSVGCSCANALVMKIEKCLPQQNKEATLIHEIIEQVNYQYELGLEHDKITVLATALYQIIVDNPEMFK